MGELRRKWRWKIPHHSSHVYNTLNRNQMRNVFTMNMVSLWLNAQFKGEVFWIISLFFSSSSLFQPSIHIVSRTIEEWKISSPRFVSIDILFTINLKFCNEIEENLLNFFLQNFIMVKKLLEMQIFATSNMCEASSWKLMNWDYEKFFFWCSFMLTTINTCPIIQKRFCFIVDGKSFINSL